MECESEMLVARRTFAARARLLATFYFQLISGNECYQLRFAKLPPPLLCRGIRAYPLDRTLAPPNLPGLLSHGLEFPADKPPATLDLL